MAYCQWSNSSPIPFLPPYTNTLEKWVVLDKQMLNMLKHTADNPAFRSACMEIVSRLLSQGGIQVAYGDKVLTASTSVRRELDGPYAQVVEGIVMQTMTWGVAFVCITGGKDEEDDEDERIGGQDSHNDVLEAVTRNLTWNKSRTATQDVGMVGRAVRREPERARPFMLDPMGDVIIEYRRHPVRPTDWRVSIADPRGTGQRIVVKGVLVVQVEPPNAVHGLSSPAQRFTATKALGDVARATAAIAMQKAALPTVYTQLTGKGLPDDGDGHDQFGMGDNFAAEEARRERNAAALDGTMPVEIMSQAAVAREQEIRDTRSETVMIERPGDQFAWNKQQVDNDPSMPFMPVHLRVMRNFLGPVASVRDGYGVVNGPESKAPQGLAEIIRNETQQAALCTGVPVSHFASEATATAVQAELRSFAQVVNRHGLVVAEALGMVLREIYHSPSDITGTASSSAKRARTDDGTRGSPAGKGEADDDEDDEDADGADSLRVLFYAYLMPELVEHLVEGGYMSPEQAIEYISRATGIPTADMTVPPVTLDPRTKGLVTTEAPEPGADGEPPKRRRMVAPGAASIRNESAEAFKKKHGD